MLSQGTDPEDDGCNEVGDQMLELAGRPGMRATLSGEEGEHNNY